jgi:uncharacterized protein (DUF362 family)
MKDSTVAIKYNKSVRNYQIQQPFNPPKNYLEISKFNFKIDKHNKIYSMIREVLIYLNMDKKNLNTSKWNPFSDFIKEGDQVFIKPNFVKHFHPLGIDGVLSQITHASVLRPIIDYVLLALNKTGNIIIADTPLDKADFNKIVKINKTLELVNFYKKKFNIKIDLIDCRTYKRRFVNEEFLNEKESLRGPPNGFITIDLKENSELSEFDCRLQNYCTLADFKVQQYNPRRTIKGSTNMFHGPNRHIYKIPKIFLMSDVIISVPKLKTHKLAGITLNLKNMIGISEKIYLPHYRQGPPPIGDAFLKQPQNIDIAKKLFQKNIHKILEKMIPRKLWIIWKKFQRKSRIKLFYDKIKPTDWWGGWYGNDTLWRTIVDLNKIMLYCDKEGFLKNEKQRKYFSIIDGVIAQEGEGPMGGKPKICSLIIGSYDALASDSILAYMMGYDIDKLNLISKVKQNKSMNIGINEIDKIRVISNFKYDKNLNLKFELPLGYKEIRRK